MRLSYLMLFSAVIVALKVVFILWIAAAFSDDHLLVQFFMVLWGFFLGGGVLWMGYSIYLLYRVIPEVDSVIDPELNTYLEVRGDFLIHRAHRLILYAVSSTSNWANRRLHPGFNFSSLPMRLSLPLQMHAYWLWLIFASLLVGAGAGELAEYLGVE